MVIQERKYACGCREGREILVAGQASIPKYATVTLLLTAIPKGPT